jgi:iron complex transport system permease protein
VTSEALSLPFLGRYSRPRLLMVLASGVALIASCTLLSALFGGVPLDFSDLLHDQGSARTILFALRLPRIALAGLVGAALCASGAALQSLLQNPLADPFVLGVSGGAAVGGTVGLLLGEWLRLPGTASWAMPLGFASALGAAALVRSLATRGGRVSTSAALLAGAVLNSVAAGLVLLAQLAVSPERGQQILLWLSGSLGYPTPAALSLAAACIAIGCGGLWALAGRIRLLSLGAEEAQQLGVPVVSTVRWSFALAALIVAAAVALSGLIGFVGLLVPHVLRLWLGPDQRLLLPSATLFGAGFLIATDGLSRLCFLPLGVEPPVGAVTALLGGPMFLWLLRRQLREGQS